MNRYGAETIVLVMNECLDRLLAVAMYALCSAAKDTFRSSRL